MSKQGIILFFYFVMLVSGENACAILLTEIMFNPSDRNEWVEFFTEDANITLSEVQISDNYASDNIVCCIENCSLNIPENTYFLVSGSSPETAAKGNFSFCTDDSKIGNGLGNSGDTIVLFSGKTTLVNLSFSHTVTKGNTLSLINGSYIEAWPSPFGDNTEFISQENTSPEQKTADVELIFMLNETIYANTNYTSFFMVKNKNYPGADETVNVLLEYNISYIFKNLSEPNATSQVFRDSVNISFKSYKTSGTGNIFLERPGTYIICGTAHYRPDQNPEDNSRCVEFIAIDPETVQCNVSLQSAIGRQIYESGEQIQLIFNLSNQTFPYEIEYWVEDIFGNIVREKTKTKNTNTKHITLKIGDPDKAFYIKSVISRILCNNSYTENPNLDLVVIKGENISNEESSIEIIEHDEESEFGDTLMLRLSVNKGNTNKYSVKVYIEGSGKTISEVSSLNFHKKYSGAEISIPVRIKDNCGGNYKEGEYYIAAEGLDTEARSKIKVLENSKCAEKTTAVQQESSGKMYELISAERKNQTIISVIHLSNREESGHTYTISSAVYSGRKRISSENTENISLDKNSEKQVILLNDIDADYHGEAALRINILREDRKTPYQITSNLSLTGNEFQKATTAEHDSLQGASLTESGEMTETALQDGAINTTAGIENKLTGEIIYSSKNETIKKNLIYLVITIICLSAAALYKKKKS